MRATLAQAFERIMSGELHYAVLPEFVDRFYAEQRSEARLAMLTEPPSLTGDRRLDALAGAIAHYLANQNKLEAVPQWTYDPERFLKEPWHVHCVEMDWNREYLSDGMREYLTFASPAEFKSRNIFTEERPIRRARTPIA